MIVYIGHKYLLDNVTLVHVQDTSNLSLTAKVGVPDKNGMMWDTEWVEWSRLSRKYIFEEHKGVTLGKAASEYVENVMERVITYIDINGRSKKDLKSDLDSIYRCICDCFCRGMSLNDAIKYVKCLEHYNEKLPEDLALKRMKEISAKYVQKPFDILK